MRLPAEIQPDQVRAVIDTREQTPLNLSPLQSMIGTLDTGDYSLVGLESHVAIERKSLGDLLACCGRERERFEREVQRLLSYPCRALVVETTWGHIEMGQWARSRLTPNQVLGALIGWIERGWPVVMAGDHAMAGRLVSRLLFTYARRRWRELRAMATIIQEPSATSVTTAQEITADAHA